MHSIKGPREKGLQLETEAQRAGGFLGRPGDKV